MDLAFSLTRLQEKFLCPESNSELKINFLKILT